jgi:hypothetical protein
MGTGSSFPGGKARPRRDADHSPPPSAEVKNEQELYLLFPQAPPWRVAGQLFFFYFLQSLTDLGRLTYSYLDNGRTPLTSDQPVARPLPTQDNTTQKDADKHPCLERDSNPRSQQPTVQDPRPRPYGNFDLHSLCLHFVNTGDGHKWYLHGM